MPFSGKWAYNVFVSPPYTDANSSHPAVHHRYYGDWAVDLYASAGTPVRLQVSSASPVSFSWVAFANGSCGQRTGVAINAGGVSVGTIYYEHLSGAVKSGPITNGMVLGHVASFGSCNGGPHIHMELRNASKYACWSDHGRPGITLSEGTSLGRLGSTNVGPAQACGNDDPPPGSPTGNVELASGAAGNFIQLGGWVMDPDAPRTSTSVHAYIDGPAGSGAPMVPADAGITRPDVAAVFQGASAEHGFSYAIGGISPGEHTVYVYGINIAGGGENPLLRAVKVTVPDTQAGSPFGSLDSAEGLVGGRGRVTGWTIDPDARRTSTDVHAYVDGPAGSGARGIILGRAGRSRPDVAKIHGRAGNDHGFDKTIGGLTPGVHTLWVYAINAAGGGENPLLGAKTITVPKGAAPRPHPQRCRMPDLVGRRYFSLNKALRKAGCEARFKPDKSKRCWVVEKQTPRKGKLMLATASVKVSFRHARCRQRSA
jgi:hypothetical protein